MCSVALIRVQRLTQTTSRPSGFVFILSFTKCGRAWRKYVEHCCSQSPAGMLTPSVRITRSFVFPFISPRGLRETFGKDLCSQPSLTIYYILNIISLSKKAYESPSYFHNKVAPLLILQSPIKRILPILNFPYNLSLCRFQKFLARRADVLLSNVAHFVHSFHAKMALEVRVES